MGNSYNDCLETELYEKLVAGILLDREELSRLQEFEIDYSFVNMDTNSRYITVKSIVLLKDKYFCLRWEMDTHDSGQHTFSDQPIEVEKEEVTREEWVEVN